MGEQKENSLQHLWRRLQQRDRWPRRPSVTSRVPTRSASLALTASRASSERPCPKPPRTAWTDAPRARATARTKTS